jgi:hypothetical protein
MRHDDAGEAKPVAVLVCLDGEQFTRTLSGLPPPSEILIPRRVRYDLSDSADGSSLPDNHRRFVLQRSVRSRAHRWWEIYNNGRSQTPHDGFVYLEAR